MEMDQAWVYKRHYSLDCNDFPVAQPTMGSAALVLGSVLISTSFRFSEDVTLRWIRLGYSALVHSVRIFGFGSAGKV